MATLHIRNVPDSVVECLKERAATRRRSLNAEAVAVLSASAVERRSVDELLREIQELAASLNMPDDWDPAEDIRQGHAERDARILDN